MPIAPFKWIDKFKPWRHRSYQDNQQLAQPKPGMRLRSYKAFRANRSKVCEKCGLQPFGKGQIIRHHVKSRGAGGNDEPGNFVDLCIRCERDAHNGRIWKDELLGIIQARLAREMVEDEKARGGE